MTLWYMADSVTPISGIPVKYQAQRNMGAALYGNGDFAAPPEVIAHYPRHLLISVNGDKSAANSCAILDVERYDATAADWPEFRATRDEICRTHDGYQWPIVYCSIDPDPMHGVAAILHECRLAGQEPPWHWWIAWYTDGHFMPSQEDVAVQIHSLTGLHVDPTTIWGCQFADFGHYDASVIYQRPSWQ